MKIFYLFLSGIVAAFAQSSFLFVSMSGTAIKNRRYETVPINIYDSNGKAIPNILLKRTASDGLVTYDCQDVTGQIRKNNEEYKRPNNHFVYKCLNGIETVQACIGSPRSNGLLIPVNQTTTKDGFWYKCTLDNKTSKATYTEEDACDIGGKLYHIGEVVTVGPSTIKCDSDASKMVVMDPQES